jgi:hypothetical protein
MGRAMRDIRDILAECMRRERLGLIRPLWFDWCAFDNEGGPEEWRRRADHLIRTLKELGVAVVHSGTDAGSAPSSSSRVIYRFKIHGRNAERLIRKAAGDDWQVVSIENGVETVEQTFTIQQAMLNGGLVLIDHPDAKTIPGLGRQLAALNEIFRMDAAAMEPAP